MRAAIAYGVRSLRWRSVLLLTFWSLVQAGPTALSGLAVARALDHGFLVDRPSRGLAWLGGYLLASCVGAIGARQLYRGLGGLVEPVRDDLVNRVVAGALLDAVAGRPDEAALARLTRQVEIVRDTYAGLLVVLLGFLATVAGIVVGLWSVAPVLILVMLPLFLLGVGAFLGTLGLASARFRTAVLTDERLAGVTGQVLGGTRDVVACGTERRAEAFVAGPIAAQAAAERAIAYVSALRTLCFAIGGWGPLIALLASGPTLMRQGVTPGELLGGMTYVLVGLQPTLRTLITAVGHSALRYAVTLGRLLEASAAQPTPRTPGAPMPSGYDMVLRGVTFRYGPQAEPVLRDLDLTVDPGEHLAIVGPSGIGKSTLANLLCGLLRPDTGAILLGGAPAADLAPDRLASIRTLIPQEAYVFSGTVWENLTYLRPTATMPRVRLAVAAVGTQMLVRRLGGLSARLDPGELSAGERQLIALTRAYLAEARVVVLDEATCHLDPAAERQAEEAFAERPGTLIVIAHRISSAIRAQRVLVLDGTSATTGSHESVLARSSLYADLVAYWHQASPRVPEQRRRSTMPADSVPAH
jgi:ATP-binding cassette subfamily C protein